MLHSSVSVRCDPDELLAVAGVRGFEAYVSSSVKYPRSLVSLNKIWVYDNI